MRNQVREALSKYRQEGGRELLLSILSYIGYEINNLLVAFFSKFTIDTEELISYCDRDGRIWYYHDSEQLEIDVPICGDPPNNEHGDVYESSIGKRTSQPAFVCELENAKLLGPHAVCQTNDGHIVSEPVAIERKLFHFFKNAVSSMGIIAAIREVLIPFTPLNKESDTESVGYLFPKGGFTLDNYPNYGHWMVENLPQLLAMEHYQQETGKELQLLVNEDPPEWLVESLSCMGHDNWVEWSHDCKKFDKVVMPRWYHTGSRMSDVHPYGRKCVRERMVKNVSDDSTESPKYIFVSREGASRRQITNIDEVKGRLEKLGFEFYRPENMSMEDEIRVFSQADVIVGPYGANLAGILFAKDSTVIDLHPHEHFGAYYMILANELGLEYGFLTGKPGERDPTRIHRNQDILVDIDELEEILINTIGI